MDLSIDFRMPGMSKVHSRKLADLSPGGQQACLACAPTELTSGLESNTASELCVG
jgi:hypothetical protein